MRFPLILALAAMTLPLGGCATVGYYAQAARGHLDLMRRREPIDRLLAQPDLDADLRARLTEVMAIRDFASRELGLPDNDSYRSYADLERNAVVWNVFAAPALSVEPHTWCFPIVGCIGYKGYFAEASARTEAATLAEQGFDVYVGGVAAYSTLGRFDDPMLNTMLGWDITRTAGLIFHELAHQVLYVKGDSAYNEAFATLVEQEGMRRWVQARGEPELLTRWSAGRDRSADFARLIAQTRAELQAVYAGAGPDDDKRVAKAAAFETLRARYATLRDESWGGYAGYDAWFASELNNARLSAVSTYRRLVPAFRALLVQEGNDLPRFYAAAEALGELAPEARQARLRALLAVSESSAVHSNTDSGG